MTLEEWKAKKNAKLKTLDQEPKKEIKEEVKVESSKAEIPVEKKISYNSQDKDKNDNSRLGENRSRYSGFNIGHYIQTPPMIFTRDGHNVMLGDMYRGASAFLILGGPSISKLDLTLLDQPGILTMGVNNSVKTFRPNLWMCVDSPQSFIMSTWLDSTITKFVPYASAEKRLFDNNKWKMSDITVGQCPSVFYYRRNEHFKAEQFLLEDTFNWGNHSNLCHCGYWRNDLKKLKKGEKKITVCPECGQTAFGSRSVLLPAVRMMYFLGVRNLFLLGCDFQMKSGQKNYHFDQDRTNGSVNGNNSSYKMLTKRFSELKPIFDKMGYQIFNCNPESNLDVFPKVDYKEAIETIIACMPDTKNERTKGLYDRKKTKE